MMNNRGSERAEGDRWYVCLRQLVKKRLEMQGNGRVCGPGNKAQLHSPKEMVMGRVRKMGGPDAEARMGRQYVGKQQEEL